MATSVLKGIYDFLFDLDFDQKVLVTNSRLTISILVLYIVFVKWIGPALMKERKPFDLKNVIIVYNFMQVVCNSLITFAMTKHGIEIWPKQCMIKHNPDYEEMVKGARHLVWHLYLLKLIDLADTVFFVLRKKQSHVTFLHLFHHSVMVLMMQQGVSAHDVGYFALVGFSINTFIHVVMYFYYFLAAFGPHVQKYLWWKKYLTIMQMIQFGIILIYMGVMFAVGCEELGYTEVSSFIYISLLFLLFLNFYRKTFKTE